MTVLNEGMTFIAKTTLTGTQAIEFTSIPSSYESLLIVITSLGNYGGGSTLDLTLRVNSDSSSNYGQLVSFGDASAASYSASANSNHVRVGNMPGNANSGVRALNLIYIYDYGSTTRRRQIIGESYHGFGRAGSYAGMYNNSSTAITSIQIQGENGTYQTTTGTYAALYGIAGA